MLVPQAIIERSFQLADLMAPYEPWAQAIDWDVDAERRDLFRVLELEGMYSQHLFDLVVEIGRLIQDTLSQGIERLERQGAAPGQFKREIREFNFELNRLVTRPLQRRGRLSSEVHRECEAISHFLDINNQVARRGKHAFQIMYDQTHRQMSDGYKKLVDLFMMAVWGRVSGNRCPRLPQGITDRDAVALLHDVDLQPTSEPLPVDLPLNFYHYSVKTTLQIIPDQDPLIVAVFRAVAGAQGEYTFEWALSRLHGGLVGGGYRLISTSFPFRQCRNLKTYAVIRHCSMVAIVEALLDGRLKEIGYLPPEALAEPEELPQGMEAIDDELVEPTSDEVEMAVPIALPPKTAVAADDGAAVERVRELRKLVLPSGALTWRRIMSALRRCGVEIRWGSRHPRLYFQGRVATWLNPHSDDAGQNRRVLSSTLRVLGIERQVFIDAL